jgi:hypothetical protein
LEQKTSIEGFNVPELNCFDYGGQLAAHHVVLIFAFPSPVRRLDSSQTSGDLGEHCLSSAVGHGLCAPPGRVAQPRLLAKYRGNPAGAARWGRLFFGYFLFGEAKESD